MKGLVKTEQTPLDYIVHQALSSTAMEQGLGCVGLCGVPPCCMAVTAMASVSSDTSWTSVTHMTLKVELGPVTLGTVQGKVEHVEEKVEPVQEEELVQE
ncbi:unnamed protein product [Gadus morhua 'NCC']